MEIDLQNFSQGLFLKKYFAAKLRSVFSQWILGLRNLPLNDKNSTLYNALFAWMFPKIFFPDHTAKTLLSLLSLGDLFTFYTFSGGLKVQGSNIN